MKITMIGTGYVGLVSATCFAEMGHFVTCLDIDEKKIENLKRGIIPIYEPLLEEMVIRNFKAERLRFTLNPKEAVQDSSVCFIAVPTLSTTTGDADLSHVFSAVDTLIDVLQKETLIVLKSTVPVGTTKKVKTHLDVGLKNKKAEFRCDVAFNPEFLKEGCAVMDFMKPDRVILGSEELKSLELLKKVYAPFTLNHDRMITMGINSAEMTKYAANVMLASRISLMNEFANFCEKVGANIHDIRIGIGSDDRIGYQFLYAGCGFGGSCFPKDIKALQAMMRHENVDTFMIDAIQKVNEHQKFQVVHKLNRYFPDLTGKVITLLGLSFKPDTDDIREASSITIVKELLKKGCYLKLYDPIAMDHFKKIFKESSHLSYEKNEYEALIGSDALVLVTEWKQFRQLDFEIVQSKMRTKAVFDGRNQYQKQHLQNLGFYYEGIGVV